MFINSAGADCAACHLCRRVKLLLQQQHQQHPLHLQLQHDAIFISPTEFGTLGSLCQRKVKATGQVQGVRNKTKCWVF